MDPPIVSYHYLFPITNSMIYIKLIKLYNFRASKRLFNWKNKCIDRIKLTTNEEDELGN